MRILSFFKKKYKPLNLIHVSKSALIENYSNLSHIDRDIAVAPVLKSNAYGHGLTLVAKVLDHLSAPFFCVDSLYEGYELLRNRIKTKVLIMGYVTPDNLKVKKLPFSYAVYDREFVAAVSFHQKHAGVHIFVDTGMRREGVTLSELPRFMKFVTEKQVRVEGVMSHLAKGEDVSYTKKQLAQFEKAKEIVLSFGHKPTWFHIAASSGLLRNNEYKGALGNLSRVGISLYGIDPEGKNHSLIPVLQSQTTLIQIKNIRRGECVGYDFTYIAKKDMLIGILPLGYYDGIDRRLSNKGSVLLHGKECRVIGRVSMNLTTIDISEVENPKIGDNIIVYSRNALDKNSIVNSARFCETIPYDLLTNLTQSTKRVLVIAHN